MPEPSIIDARLAEIDRRLRTIQTGLKAAEPAVGDLDPVAQALEEPPLPPPTPLRPTPASATSGEAGKPEALEADVLVDRLRALSEAHERLLELHRDLLAQYAGVLEHRAAPSATASVTAGPFADAASVRAFEQGLATLPGVAAVTVREFLGPDRVALEVTLGAL
jgi:hypothetical protein